MKDQSDWTQFVILYNGALNWMYSEPQLQYCYYLSEPFKEKIDSTLFTFQINTEFKMHYRDTYNLNFTHSKYVDLLQHAGQYCSIEGVARVLQYCPKCCNKSKYFE